MLSFIKRLFTKKRPPQIDPLDPHGDGTIRKGDPMHDVFMQALETGEPVIGTITPDGKITQGDE